MENPSNYIPFATQSQKDALAELFKLRDLASRRRDIGSALEFDTIVQLYMRHIIASPSYIRVTNAA